MTAQSDYTVMNGGMTHLGRFLGQGFDSLRVHLSPFLREV